MLALNFICLSCFRVADACEIRYIACGDMIEVAENTDKSSFAYENVYQLIEHTDFCIVGGVIFSFLAVSTNILLPLQLTSAIEGFL